MNILINIKNGFKKHSVSNCFQLVHNPEQGDPGQGFYGIDRVHKHRRGSDLRKQNLPKEDQVDSVVEYSGPRESQC